MRIAIIGAGNVGKALGQGWARSGHDVVYGMRESGLAAPHAGSSVDTVRAAAGSGEVVVLSTPWSAVGDVLTDAGDLGGKILVDATNPIGPGFTLTVGHTTSGAEQVAALAKSARVVKAFNSTGFENMANPRYGGSRVVMPVAGDDSAAVHTVVGLAGDLGFEAVGLPSLTRARDIEPFALLWIKLALQWGHGRGIGYVITRRAPDDRAPERRPTRQRRTITLVGSGNIGGALGRAWLRAGHAVRVATRDASAKDVAELVALGATATPVAGAAEGAEVIVFAIPAGAVVETATTLGNLRGKVVVDCTNAIGKGFTLVHGHTTSASEEVAKALPGARVVRAFNQQGAEVLQNPTFGGRPATNFIAADDDQARAIVKELSTEVGLDSVEAGPLGSSRYLEPITLLWIAMAQSLGTRSFGLSLRRR